MAIEKLLLVNGSKKKQKKTAAHKKTKKRTSAKKTKRKATKKTSLTKRIKKFLSLKLSRKHKKTKRRKKSSVSKKIKKSHIKKIKGGKMAKRKKKAYKTKRKSYKKHKKTTAPKIKGRYRVRGTLALNPRRGRAKAIGMHGFQNIFVDGLWVIGGLLISRIIGSVIQKFIKDPTISQIIPAAGFVLIPIKIPNREKLALGSLVNATLAIGNRFIPTNLQNTLKLPSGFGELKSLSAPISGLASLQENVTQIPGDKDIVEEIEVLPDEVSGYYTETESTEALPDEVSGYYTGTEVGDESDEDEE